MSNRHRNRPVPMATLTYYMRRNDGIQRIVKTFDRDGSAETYTSSTRGTPYGVVMGVILPDGKLSVGYSRTETKSVLHKKSARSIALGRALYHNNTNTPGYEKMLDRLVRLKEKLFLGSKYLGEYEHIKI